MFLFVMKGTKKVVLSLAVVLIAGLGIGIPVIAPDSRYRRWVNWLLEFR